MLPRRVSMKSDTARTRDCAVNNAWSNARLSRSAASRSSRDVGQQAVQLGVGLGQSGEGAERIGAPALCACDTALTAGFPRGAEFARPAARCPVRSCAPAWSMPFWMSAIDGGQPGHRAIDVGGGAVDGVEQRAGLAERRLGRPDRRRRARSARPAGRATSARAVVMLPSANASRCLASSMLPATEDSAVSANCARSRPASVGRVDAGRSDRPSAGSTCRAGSGALITRSRSWSKASRCASSSRSAFAAATIDTGQQVAPLQWRLGHRVVEGLAHIERLGQRVLGVGHRAGERCGVAVAEFLDRQRQFAVAGAHRVVDVDHDRLGQVVERVDGTRRPAHRGPRVHPLCGGELGLAALARCAGAATAPAPARASAMTAEHDAAPLNQRSRATAAGVGSRPSAAATAAPAQSPAAQQRLDVVAPHVVGVDSLERSVGASNAYGRSTVATARIASWSPKSLMLIGGLRPTPGCSGREVCRRRPPTAGSAASS